MGLRQLASRSAPVHCCADLQAGHLAMLHVFSRKRHMREGTRQFTMMPQQGDDAAFGGIDTVTLRQLTCSLTPFCSDICTQSAISVGRDAV